jgi:hypothetical protein
MPATDYEELHGMPQGCLTTPPWGFDGIEIHAPYQGVDEVTVVQEPLISSGLPQAQFEMFSNEEVILDLDAPGVSIGYWTDAEEAVFLGLRVEASVLKNNTAFYHPDAKESIVALATEAYDLLADIVATYEAFDQALYTNKEGDFVAFPLSLNDGYVEGQVQPSPSYPSSMQARVDARNQIRDNYLKTIYFLWCAEYGKNQSIAWRENKKIFDASHAPSPGLQTGPSAPPPMKPGRVTTRPGQPPLPPGGLIPPGPGPFPPEDYGPFLPGEEPPDGFPDDGGFPGGLPDGPPPSTSKKKAGGAGAIVLLGVVVVALMASK